MRKLILVCSVFFIVVGLNASVKVEPSIARISSYMQGIVDMKVNLGQHVKQGQLLFTISTEYTEIFKSKCENEVWYYKAEYDRVKKLSLTHSKSIEDVQEAKYNLDNAIGDLKKEDLLIKKWSKYYAPFDGVVNEIYNYSGSSVADASGNSSKYNAVVEVIKLEDYNKLKDTGGIIKKQAVAQVAPMIEGLVDLKVISGEKVKKGQLLFKIDTAYNDITKVQQEAKIKNKKEIYERTKNLYEKNVDSLKSYQTSKYEYINAVQDLKGTKLIINKRSSYHAPFDSVVSNIIHYSGSNAFAGHKVLELTKI